MMPGHDRDVDRDRRERARRQAGQQRRGERAHRLEHAAERRHASGQQRQEADHQPDAARRRDLVHAAAEEPRGARRGDREAQCRQPRPGRVRAPPGRRPPAARPRPARTCRPRPRPRCPRGRPACAGPWRRARRGSGTSAGPRPRRTRRRAPSASRRTAPAGRAAATPATAPPPGGAPDSRARAGRGRASARTRWRRRAGRRSGPGSQRAHQVLPRAARPRAAFWASISRHSGPRAPGAGASCPGSRGRPGAAAARPRASPRAASTSAQATICGRWLRYAIARSCVLGRQPDGTRAHVARDQARTSAPARRRRDRASGSRGGRGRGPADDAAKPERSRPAIGMAAHEAREPQRAARPCTMGRFTLPTSVITSRRPRGARGHRRSRRRLAAGGAASTSTSALARGRDRRRRRRGDRAGARAARAPRGRVHADHPVARRASAPSRASRR